MALKIEAESNVEGASVTVQLGALALDSVGAIVANAKRTIESHALRESAFVAFFRGAKGDYKKRIAEAILLNIWFLC